MKNSLSKGNSYENLVFEFFKRELKSGRLAFYPRAGEIFAKRSYYSTHRKKDIVFDIAIEISLPGKKDWTHLMLIECKNYEKRVPVDDIEEFSSKVIQVSLTGVKGIVVSRNGFQEGAVNFAKSNHIALIRLLDNKNFKWVLNRVATRLPKEELLKEVQNDVFRALTQKDYNFDNFDFYANYVDTFTNSPFSLINSMYPLAESGIDLSKTNTNNPNLTVPFISLESIENKVNEVKSIVKFNKSEQALAENCRELQEKFDIRIMLKNHFERDSLGFVKLGMIQFDPTLITIFLKAQSNKFRQKFTLAHELGHFFLKHNRFLIKEYYSELDYESAPTFRDAVQEISKIEWQANQFASCFLLPKDEFLYTFNCLVLNENLIDKGFGTLFVDNQHCNLNTFYRITNELRDIFRVSRTTIEIRLKNLGLLNDKRSVIKPTDEFIIGRSENDASGGV